MLCMCGCRMMGESYREGLHVMTDSLPASRAFHPIITNFGKQTWPRPRGSRCTPIVLPPR